ncbi:hypothetical protein, partial [Hymenobacter sp. UV11]|uniref:hypothetical protein n=1 Tax=Hymenobacter sp. UV11 TaxID=1849735 RepID=UPI001C2BABF2
MTDMTDIGPGIGPIGHIGTFYFNTLLIYSILMQTMILFALGITYTILVFRQLLTISACSQY